MVASGSYSSLARWVFHGDRLAPQVIHRPWAGAVSTGLYLTSASLPVAGSCARVSTAMGDGSRPYMDSPFWLCEAYSNCTTANTVLPLTPGTRADGRASRDMPSGQSEKNWRALPGTELSMMGRPWISR